MTLRDRPLLNRPLVFFICLSFMVVTVFAFLMFFRPVSAKQKLPADKDQEDSPPECTGGGGGCGHAHHQFRPQEIRRKLTHEFRKIWTADTPNTVCLFSGDESILVATPETIRCFSGFNAIQLWGMSTDVPLVPDSLTVVGNRMVIGRTDGLVAIRPVAIDGAPISWQGPPHLVQQIAALEKTPWAAIVYQSEKAGDPIVLELLDVYEGPTLILRLKGNKRNDKNPRPHVPAIVWGASSEQIAVTLSDSTISVFDISTGRLVDNISAANPVLPPRPVGFLPDNRLALMYGKRLSIIRIDTGEELFSKQITGSASRMTDGEQVVISSQAENGDGVFDLLDGESLQKFTALRIPRMQAYHSATEKGLVVVLDSRNRIFVQSLILAAEWGDVLIVPDEEPPLKLSRIRINPNVTRIAVSAEGQLRIIDLEANAEIARLDDPSLTDKPDIQFNRSGNLIRVRQVIYRIAKKEQPNP